MTFVHKTFLSVLNFATTGFRKCDGLNVNIRLTGKKTVNKVVPLSIFLKPCEQGITFRGRGGS